MDQQEKKTLKKFEQLLSYSFKKRELLKRALTHKSYVNERQLSPLEHNERYEYLGDAVLELAISHLLMEQFPNYPEGELSKLRAAVVNETQLAQLALAINLGEYLYLGKGEDQTQGREKPSLLSNALEAVLAAVYLDRGFEKAQKVISQHFKPILKMADQENFLKDYKTRLQEISQNRFRAIPAYHLIREIGPDHRKTFEVHLFIKNDRLGVGKGASKKAAEQEAARQALEKLENGDL